MPEVFELADQQNTQAVIKVIGVGGGGGNTVNQMVAGGIKGVDFMVWVNQEQPAVPEAARSSQR